MKKLTLAVAALLPLGLASAQRVSQQYEGWNGTFTFQGCARSPEGVRCNFDYAPKLDLKVG